MQELLASVHQRPDPLPDVHPWHLVNCVNEVYSYKSNSWDEALQDTNSTEGVVPLGVLGAWWTSKPARLPLTVVTHVSATRLYQLRAQCRSWPGPTSAVVYTSIHQPSEMGQNLTEASLAMVRGVIKGVEDLAKDMEAAGDEACQLDVLLVFEQFSDTRGHLLYPFNILRNFARLQARTRTLGFFDIDMLIAKELAASITGPSGPSLIQEFEKPKSVMVVAAFQTTKKIDNMRAPTMADKLVRMSKSEFISAVKEQDLAEPFDLMRYPPGHNWTLFDKWWSATEPYPITAGFGFEPWIIADRLEVVWHDTRYRGYGWDKVVFIALLNASSFNFSVHHSAYIVHRNHQHTAASMSFFKTYSKQPHLAPEGLIIRDRNERIFDMQKADWDTGNVIPPVLDIGTINCRNKLPWWNGKDGGTAATSAAAAARKRLFSR